MTADIAIFLANPSVALPSGEPPSRQEDASRSSHEFEAALKTAQHSGDGVAGDEATNSTQSPEIPAQSPDPLAMSLSTLCLSLVGASGRAHAAGELPQRSLAPREPEPQVATGDLGLAGVSSDRGSESLTPRPTSFTARVSESGAEASSKWTQTAERAPLVAEAGPETAIFVRVESITTYLPAIVGQTLSNVQSDVAAPGNPGVQTQVDHETGKRSAVRVLKFEIEPGSLGSITVKMRMTSARVAIEIAAQSATTYVLLQDVRERLTAVVGESGFAVDALSVQLSPATTPLDMRQDGGNGPGEASEHSRQGGLSDEGASGRGRENRGEAQDRRVAEECGRSHFPSDVLL